MGESKYLNEIRRVGAEEKELEVKRQYVGDLLDNRFPGQAPEEVRRLISQLESRETLDRWFLALARAQSYADFDAVVRQ